MGLRDMFSAGKRMILANSGEPATLIHKATRIDVVGIYSVTPGGVSPLDGRTIRPGIYLTCPAEEVQGVEPGWSVDIRNQILPVIAVVSDGVSFVEIYLGDENAQ